MTSRERAGITRREHSSFIVSGVKSSVDDVLRRESQDWLVVKKSKGHNNSAASSSDSLGVVPSHVWSLFPDLPDIGFCVLHFPLSGSGVLWNIATNNDVGVP